eukprot:11165128-Lingulodinium_polyedra.AAC.1
MGVDGSMWLGRWIAVHTTPWCDARALLGRCITGAEPNADGDTSPAAQLRLLQCLQLDWGGLALTADAVSRHHLRHGGRCAERY